MDNARKNDVVKNGSGYAIESGSSVADEEMFMKTGTQFSKLGGVEVMSRLMSL